VLQGALFGTTAVIGMLAPLVITPGLIFDGRSIMLSLCALFYGPWAAAIAAMMAIVCRFSIGGIGIVTGVLVIFSSVSQSHHSLARSDLCQSQGPADIGQSRVPGALWLPLRK
jgi:hypothetical protein